MLQRDFFKPKTKKAEGSGLKQKLLKKRVTSEAALEEEPEEVVPMTLKKQKKTAQATTSLEKSATSNTLTFSKFKSRQKHRKTGFIEEQFE